MAEHAAAVATIRHTVDLDVSGEGAHTYRLPALATVAPGRLIAAYDRRHESVNDLPSPISIVVQTSADDGRTWTRTHEVRAPRDACGVGEPSLLHDGVAGRTFLFYLLAPSRVPSAIINLPEAGGDLRQMLLWSDDGGTTWNGPRDLTPEVKRPSFYGIFATGGRGIQLVSGRLLQPFSYTDHDLVPHVLNLYSDDHGATWLLGDVIESPLGLEPETRVAELADGTVIQDIRPAPEVRRRLRARSGDGGISFSPATPTLLPDPCVNADLLRVSRSEGGDILLFSNPASDTARENLTIRRSHDGGETWPESWTVHEGGAGYSVMVELQDGSIGMLFERDGERAVTFLRLDLPATATP